MTPKSILMPFNGNEQELAALETAFTLAKKWQARVDVWQVLPNPDEIMAAYASYIGAPYFPDESSYRELLKQNDASKRQAFEKFTATANKCGIPFGEETGKNTAFTTFHTTVSSIARVMRTHGCLADLIVISRDGDNRLFYDEVAGSALFDTGRPVLLVPPGAEAKPLNNKTLIAWNGSREVIHAVTAAFPFLKSNNVKILTGESDRWDAPELLPQDLADYLERHQIHADTLMPWINGSGVGETILKSAKRLDAGLVVMGAYSHSRMRELILGGVTAHMLKHADVPVLMMH